MLQLSILFIYLNKGIRLIIDNHPQMILMKKGEPVLRTLQRFTLFDYLFIDF